MDVTVTNVNKFDRQSSGGGNGDGAYDVAASFGDDGTKEPWQRIALTLIDVVLLKVLDHACYIYFKTLNSLQKWLSGKPAVKEQIFSVYAIRKSLFDKGINNVRLLLLSFFARPAAARTMVRLIICVVVDVL